MAENNFLPPVDGNRVDQIQQLQDRADYWLYNLTQNGDVVIIIRLDFSSRSKKFPVESRRYKLNILSSPLSELPLDMSYLDYQLYNVLYDIYIYMSNLIIVDEDRQGEPVSAILNLIHPSADEPFMSELRPFTEENAESSIIKVISLLGTWLQSEGSDFEITELLFTMDFLGYPLEGSGLPIFLLSDGHVRSKAMSRQNPRGSILYVNSRKHCFFISIFFALKYHLLQAEYSGEYKIKRTRDEHLAEIKSIKNQFYSLLEGKKSETWQKCKQFFQEIYQYEETDDDAKGLGKFFGNHHVFLVDFVKKAAVEVSIFSSSSNFQSIYMAPNEYDPLLTQIHLLRITLPSEKKSRN